MALLYISYIYLKTSQTIFIIIMTRIQIEDQIQNNEIAISNHDDDINELEDGVQQNASDINYIMQQLQHIITRLNTKLDQHDLQDINFKFDEIRNSL